MKLFLSERGVMGMILYGFRDGIRCHVGVKALGLLSARDYVSFLSLSQNNLDTERRRDSHRIGTSK